MFSLFLYLLMLGLFWLSFTSTAFGVQVGGLFGDSFLPNGKDTLSLGTPYDTSHLASTQGTCTEHGGRKYLYASTRK
ncbi:uncharacterized protein BCR38DRAFT_218515 [Pseudomassariella vexata]|uniref:Uncharacterized protein n=1 Tax=Pseudomassariella vexata TaxID=1141098 RepID=A0A1Y2DUW0_9PEZI|nr:uncharacterized protein BCR38DRAFT_218515 [Pseudomassariella vexata]ORY62969.1 hypothetical protein BCR38DRAFT_218515 [Pseudomassariella vexata]